jgi:hypothetical protein
MGLLLAVVFGVLLAGLLLIQVPIGLEPFQLRGAGAAILAGVFAYYALWRNIWPEPARIDLSALRTPAGHKRLVGGFLIGIAIGVIGAVAIELMIEMGLLAYPHGYGLAYGLVLGFAFGLVSGLRDTGIRSGMDPREIIRTDITGWLVNGLTIGVAGGFVGVLLGELVFFWASVALTYALAIGLVLGGYTGGAVGLRYLGFLLATRGLLPWRLGGFLHWCYGAGLLRISGIAYQFRHRELQDYLAA